MIQLVIIFMMYISFNKIDILHQNINIPKSNLDNQTKVFLLHEI